MISQDFIAASKHALEALRHQTQKVENRLDAGDLAEVLKEMAVLTGQSINLQAMTAGKASYELSEAEKGQGD